MFFERRGEVEIFFPGYRAFSVRFRRLLVPSVYLFIYLFIYLFVYFGLFACLFLCSCFCCFDLDLFSLFHPIFGVFPRLNWLHAPCPSVFLFFTSVYLFVSLLFFFLSVFCIDCFIAGEEVVLVILSFAFHLDFLNTYSISPSVSSMFTACLCVCLPFFLFPFFFFFFWVGKGGNLFIDSFTRHLDLFITDSVSICPSVSSHLWLSPMLSSCLSVCVCLCPPVRVRQGQAAQKTSVSQSSFLCHDFHSTIAASLPVRLSVCVRLFTAVSSFFLPSFSLVVPY